MAAADDKTASPVPSPESGGAAVGGAPGGSQRIDKWLWFTRVVKSRTLAAGLVTAGGVRLNRVKVEKTSTTVKAGDVLTITVHSEVRILRVVAPGTRRGPATEAALLYDDLTPPKETVAEAAAKAAMSAKTAPVAERDTGTGRPTKRDRRIMDKLRGQDQD